MAFTRPGADMAMTNQDGATGLYSFEWAYGDPVFDDTQEHRVISLLVEHAPSPNNPGYWADETGRRGSLLYTLRNVTTATPSKAEAYAAQALDWAVAGNAITYKPSGIEARRVGRGIALSVKYSSTGKEQTAKVTIG